MHTVIGGPQLELEGGLARRCAHQGVGNDVLICFLGAQPCSVLGAFEMIQSSGETLKG